MQISVTAANIRLFRRPRLRPHPRPRQTLRQDRRRDGVAGSGGRLAAELWPGAASAAASLPDSRKGERVALMTEREGATRAAFAAFAWTRGAAELMVPAEVHMVRAVPLLGSGKTDFAGVRRMAKAADAVAAVEHAV